MAQAFGSRPGRRAWAKNGDCTMHDSSLPRANGPSLSHDARVAPGPEAHGKGEGGKGRGGFWYAVPLSSRSQHSRPPSREWKDETVSHDRSQAWLDTPDT